MCVLVSKHIERHKPELADLQEDDVVSLAKTFNIIPPGRPIVSGKGTLTEYISGFVDSILQSLMPHIPSYIQDSTDFLNKLATIKDIPNNSLLVTMDVTALYTNIPHEDGVRACSYFLDTFPVTEIPTKVICSLISFILTHNNFMFGDKHYLQVSGTAMGTKMALCFANLFMALIETELIDNSPHKPLLYTRFIDDIFLIWTHGRPALDDFILRANSIHPSIKFTVEISNQNVPFLDVMVSLTPVGFKTSLYRKPTDRPTYLNYTSFHPPHIKSSIIFSQLLRFKRICSDRADYDEAVRSLVQNLLRSGYPYKLISKEIKRASGISREASLQYGGKGDSRSNRIAYVTRFNPSVNPLLHKVKRDWKNLRSDPVFSETFSCPPVLVKKQPPNLYRLLVRTKTRPPLGNESCGNPRC